MHRVGRCGERHLDRRADVGVRLHANERRVLPVGRAADRDVHRPRSGSARRSRRRRRRARRMDTRRPRRRLRVVETGTATRTRAEPRLRPARAARPDQRHGVLGRRRSTAGDLRRAGRVPTRPARVVLPRQREHADVDDEHLARRQGVRRATSAPGGDARDGSRAIRRRSRTPSGHSGRQSRRTTRCEPSRSSEPRWKPPAR